LLVENQVANPTPMVDKSTCDVFALLLNIVDLFNKERDLANVLKSFIFKEIL
jgi:hypothetical protein